MVKSIFPLILFTLGSCIMGTEDPFDDCGGNRPLDKNEKMLQKKLKDQFNNGVLISRVSYQYRPRYAGLNCEGFGKEYEISMFGWTDTQINDSIFRRKITKDLAVDIYTSILTDSLKYYIDEFKFTLGNFDSSDSLKFRVDISIKKSDVEKFLGKKLIIKNNQYQILKIKKEDNLKFTEFVRD